MTPDKYISELTASIDAATTRVYLLALVITDDPSVTSVISALERAAQRGVTVRIASDLFFTYHELGVENGRLFNFREQTRVMRQLRKRLKKAGVKLSWLGEGGITMFSRRTHSKWSVVDGTVYAFGGVNLYDDGISNVDYMFQVDDEHLADTLVEEQARIVNADSQLRLYRSHSFGDEYNKILIDGGFTGDSLIYRQACKYAKEATHVLYVSQYCPTGRLNTLLKHTSSDLYFNRWQQASSFNKWLLFVNSKLRGQQSLYQKDRYLHGKFMIFTLTDGQKVALTGSHNFITGGIWLGTREIALESRDPFVIHALESFFRKTIK